MTAKCGFIDVPNNADDIDIYVHYQIIRKCIVERNKEVRVQWDNLRSLGASGYFSCVSPNIFLFLGIMIKFNPKKKITTLNFLKKPDLKFKKILKILTRNQVSQGRIEESLVNEKRVQMEFNSILNAGCWMLIQCVHECYK